MSVVWQEPSTTCVTSKTDDCVPSAATWNTGSGNSAASHRSWSTCSRWKMEWSSIRNRCCTRSRTHDPQAASSGSSTGEGWSSSSAALGSSWWRIPASSWWSWRWSRSSCCWWSTVEWSWSWSCSFLLRRSDCGPPASIDQQRHRRAVDAVERDGEHVVEADVVHHGPRPAPLGDLLREDEGQAELQLQVSRRAVVVVPGDLEQHDLARSHVDDRGIDRDALQRRGSGERAEGNEQDRGSGDGDSPSGSGERACRAPTQATCRRGNSRARRKTQHRIEILPAGSKLRTQRNAAAATPCCHPSDRSWPAKGGGRGRQRSAMGIVHLGRTACTHTADICASGWWRSWSVSRS